MVRLQNKWLIYILLLLAYSVVYFIYSGSYPWNFHQELPGNINGDMSQFLWNAHHFGEWMAGRQEYFSTDLLYTPFGTSLQYHTYSHLMSGTAYLVGNSFLGINLVIWLHYIFSGLGAFLLARYFKLNWIWAFLVGFIFAFIPYKFFHYSGHYNLQQTAIIPFFVLAFFRNFPLNSTEKLFSKFKIRHLLTLLLLGVLSIASSYVYTVFLLFFVAGYFIYYFVFRLIPNKWMRWCLLVLLTILSTYLVPYLSKLGIEHHGAFWWTDDMGKFVTPNWNNTLYHWATPGLYEQYKRLSLKHSDCFIGYILPLFFLGISILYLLKKEKCSAFEVLGFLSLFFFMLTSPKILIFTDEFGFMPTSLYHFIPVINNVRIPDRFILMFALFFPVFTFSVAQYVLASKKILKDTLPIILILLCFIEFKQNPIGKAHKNNIPQWVNQLASLPQGNVLPLPTGINDGNIATGNFESNQLYYQTIHKHKLIGGYISRITDELRTKHLEDPVMKAILDLSKQEPIKDLLHQKQVDHFIKKFKLHYIVISNNEERFLPFVEKYFGHRVLQKNTTEGTTICVLRDE